MLSRCLAIATLLIVPATLSAQEADTTTKVVFGGYVDAYYGYDFNRPLTLDRAFTTQAARHNEFNINLGYLDVTMTSPRLHGRFAAQFGTSVQANYAAEPRLGLLSGPDVSRFIQEAYAGYLVFPKVWIDGGVFFSPFGSESWISRDNWTYTRSLIAENSPYYEAGVKATWQATPTLAAQLHIINGWQNISETNSDKALGLRLDYAPSTAVSLAYDAFVGNELPDTLPSKTRWWQEGFLTWTLSSKWMFRATFDYGMQDRLFLPGHANWHGYAVVARYVASPQVAMAARAEGYTDPDQVIVVTGLPYGMRANGWSFNVDVGQSSRVLWRTEGRLIDTRDPLFPDRASARGLVGRDPLLVTSVALTF
jgi:hypothetical protein